MSYIARTAGGIMLLLAICATLALASNAEEKRQGKMHPAYVFTIVIPTAPARRP